MIRCIIRLQFFLAAMSMSASAYAETSSSATPPTKEAIQQAWARRQASIRSIDASYSVTNACPGRIQPAAKPNDPFRETILPNDTKLNLTYTFAFKDGRLASKLDGDTIFQDGKIGRQINSAAFNGKEYRTLLQARGLYFGHFDRRGQAGDELTHEIHNLPIYLWFHPNQLMEKVGWDIANATVDRERHPVGDNSCWQLDIPRGNPDSISHLYVDDMQDFLPRRWESFYRGVLASSFDIEYQQDADGRSFVSKWRAPIFENGRLKSLVVAEVKRFRINRPIDDQTFELEFPTGAQLMEERDGGRRYYIQEKSGMRPIKESDYGKRPNNGRMSRFDGTMSPSDSTPAPPLLARDRKLLAKDWNFP